MSFSVKVLTGLVVGVLLGLGIGERAHVLHYAGDAFIGLLQMTVLPYIVVSLIINIGRLSASQGVTLFKYGAAVLGSLLSLGVVVLMLAPMAWPSREAGSFFRSSLLHEPESIDLVGLYIPANPFGALATEVVPAVVLFCMLFAVALSTVPHKERLIEPLQVIEKALVKLNKLVVRTTPAGVFFIAASAAGTMTIDELLRMQAFLISYTFIAFVLAGIALPAIVAIFTPIRARDVFKVCGGTLITIFATGKIMVVLPQLIDNAEQLLRESGVTHADEESEATLLLPLAYPFPNLGTFTIMVFVPFAAWYLGTDLSASDTAAFLAAMVPSSFVAPVIGIPFLLDVVNIPRDVFELFVVSTVFTDRIRVVVGGLHLLTLTVVTVAWLRGKARPKLGASLRWGAGVLLATALTIGGTRYALGLMVVSDSEGYLAFVDMSLMHKAHPPHTIAHADAEPLLTDGTMRLYKIRERGFLRVGVPEDALPYAFENRAGDMVGLDIELLHGLAQELGVELQVVTHAPDAGPRLLQQSRVDLLAGGLAITPDNAVRLPFTGSYLDTTLAFIARHEDRSRFERWDRLGDGEGLRLGFVAGGSRSARWISTMLPKAELVPVESNRPFLEGETPELDALISHAEGGSAWTLVYPTAAVVVPRPGLIQIPLGFATPPGETTWRIFVSQWLNLQRSTGQLDKAYDWWILGRGAHGSQPRWSAADAWLIPEAQKVEALEPPNQAQEPTP